MPRGRRNSITLRRAPRGWRGWRRLHNCICHPAITDLIMPNSDLDVSVVYCTLFSAQPCATPFPSQIAREQFGGPAIVAVVALPKPSTSMTQSDRTRTTEYAFDAGKWPSTKPACVK